MKEAIAILTGGGPAPGMNTVVGSVAKTFLAKGYRVIGLHYGYSGLFNPSPRYEDLTFTQADYIFNQGGSYLTMSRFKPTDKDFEENFNLNFFTENNVKLLVTVGGDGQPHRQVPRSEALPHRQHPRPEDDRQRPAAAGRHADVRLPVGQGGRNGHRPRCLQRRTHVGQLVRRSGHGPFGRTPRLRHRLGLPLPDDRHSGDVQQDGDHRREDRQPGRFVDHQAQDHGHRLRRGHDLGRCVPRPER